MNITFYLFVLVNAKKQVTKPNAPKPETKRRTCSKWSTHEKAIFFEALKEVICFFFSKNILFVVKKYV